MLEIKEIFNCPKVIAILGDINTGKSNLVYYLIKELMEKFTLSLYTFGLRKKIDGVNEISSLNELEQIKNSVIFLDEFISLLDLEDRTKKEQIENTLRLIYHNNNILVLIGLPENMKKFLSAKVTEIIYKKVTISDFINGSRVKKNITDYKGVERGTSILNLEKNEIIYFNGRYKKYEIPYLEDYDTKKDNVEIIVEK